MAYINTYKEPTPVVANIEGLLDPSIPFDFNFPYPVVPLQNDRVKLLPFVPATFAKDFIELVRPNPELFKYIPIGPWNLNEFLEFMDTIGRRKSDWVFFAVLDMTKAAEGTKPWGDGKLAGIIALLNTEPVNFSTEIGCVIIGKDSQRTHVTTNAVGLLLQWCFEDLGMRRVQWQANYRNEPSVNAAKKMKFRDEGVIRWQRVIPRDKGDVGEHRVRDGVEEIPGRHSAMLSICWDDWESGVKDAIAERMARTV